jgi:hypothetical protein
MINWNKTERGFGRGEFMDRYGVPCSIQESSLATEQCIWLGCDHEQHDQNGRPVGARMHLTREMRHDRISSITGFADVSRSCATTGSNLQNATNSLTCSSIFLFLP